MPGSNSTPAASFGLLLMRLGAGALLIYGHGWPKLVHFAERAGRFPDPLRLGHDRSLMLAIFAELACAALVMIGFATRFASAVIVGLFAVILLMVTRGAPYTERELAMVYCVPFLCLVFTGGGAYALDARYAPTVKLGGGK
jgi:putative oxidoreductase